MTEETSPMQRPDELEHLKAKAKVMNISHSGNIGVDALRAKINAKLAGEADNTNDDGHPNQPNPLEMGAKAIDEEIAREERESIQRALEAEKPVQVMSLRQYMMKEQLKLVRCRVTNLDPKKKDLPGEIFTVANEYLGTVRKFIPFGEATDGGFHIPQCIFNFMESRKFVSITSKKDRATGQITVSNRDVREFALEIMDPLTDEELRELATAQLAAGSVE